MPLRGSGPGSPRCWQRLAVGSGLRIACENPPEPVSAQSALKAAMSETLATLWQASLRGSPGVALCLVELRGFEPLTPCMPCKCSTN
jgi:hypothetical protein